MNKFKRFVALALVLCMVMAFLPAGVSAAVGSSYAYNIVHVDMMNYQRKTIKVRCVCDDGKGGAANGQNG